MANEGRSFKAPQRSGRGGNEPKWNLLTINLFLIDAGVWRGRLLAAMFALAGGCLHGEVLARGPQVFHAVDRRVDGPLLADLGDWRGVVNCFVARLRPRSL